MSSRNKLIIFFAVIAALILILGIFWVREGGGRIEASPNQIASIKGNEIKVTFDDYSETVSPGATVTYNLQILNNTSKDLENLRVFGQVGLPPEENIIDETAPDWLSIKNSRNYPDNYYFDYLIDLNGRSKATAKIPAKIKRFDQDQDKVYAKVSVQALTVASNDRWWNIFSLGGGYSGPIIASVEDINDLE